MNLQRFGFWNLNEDPIRVLRVIHRRGPSLSKQETAAYGRVTVQAVSSQRLTAEPRVQSSGSPIGICDEAAMEQIFLWVLQFPPSNYLSINRSLSYIFRGR
jgi:hypothetical protein